ncbi:MAG: 6-pyruvoyl trahydropterin synthase family protein [Planctomycetota bacterium]|jgi:6-pyruvoyl-tetrahydropterin synthase
MHTLSRQIRFMIDPFEAVLTEGHNSYASRPAGEGVGLYFSLWVDLESQLDGPTGFVVNVSEIDKLIRSEVIPIFKQTVQAFFACKKTPLLLDMVCLLRKCWPVVQAGFVDKQLKQLKLELNPFRQITIQSEDAEMFTFSEKFEFAAMHRADEFLEWVDHKNLNVDVEAFKELNPTVENLSIFAWEKLEGKFKNCKLSNVTVWENDRTYCSYSR